jgi:hypothetical protein
MRLFTEYSLGAEGVRFVLASLSAGRTFAKRLLERRPIVAGTAATHLPQDAAVDRTALLNFSSGGKLLVASPVPWEVSVDFRAPTDDVHEMTLVPNTNDFLVTLIANHLARSDTHVCLFEDANARPDDPRLSFVSTRFATIGDDVVHFLQGPRAGLDDVDRLIRVASSWLVIGALSSLPETGFLRDRAPIEDRDLRQLVDQTQRIIVGAYDGEAYVVWSPPELTA